MRNQPADLKNSEVDSANERWLSVEEIASHLGVSKDTIYTWLSQQKIPSHRVGKLWKFRQSEVDQWVLAGSAASFKNKETSR